MSKCKPVLDNEKITHIRVIIKAGVGQTASPESKDSKSVDRIPVARM